MGGSVSSPPPRQPRALSTPIKFPDETPYYADVKYVLLGDNGVGKSSLATRWAFNLDDPGYSSDSLVTREMTYAYGRHKKLRVMFYDFLRSYYNRIRPANAVLLCFDVNGPVQETMQGLRFWHERACTVLEMFTNVEDGPQLIAFVGCKVEDSMHLARDPWSQARHFYVAFKPKGDTMSLFALLPVELLAQIMRLFLHEVIHDSGDGLQVAGFESIRYVDLLALSMEFETPVYLTSAKVKIGTQEVLSMITESVMEEQDSAFMATHWQSEPYCICGTQYKTWQQRRLKKQEAEREAENVTRLRKPNKSG